MPPGWANCGEDEVDMVITLVNRQPPAGFQSQVLLELPMILLAQGEQNQVGGGTVARDKIDEPLICLPAQEVLTKIFQAKLAEIGVEWFPTIEASSTDLIETYVATGLGVGLSGGGSQTDIAGKYKGAAVARFSAGFDRRFVAREALTAAGRISGHGKTAGAGNR